MRPTEQLKEEHEGIKLMLEILEKICQKLEAGAEVPAAELEKVIEFIRVFADRCHHGKEEDLLFPEMEKAGVPRDQGPIGVMLLEHGKGREYVRGMSDALLALQKKEPRASSRFVENARGYIALLTQHIQKENEILFPWGEKVLSDAQKEALWDGFEKVEQERIGAGRHEEFHALLGQLKEIYLG